jgi:hypothetical protein
MFPCQEHCQFLWMSKANLWPIFRVQFIVMLGMLLIFKSENHNLRLVRVIQKIKTWKPWSIKSFKKTAPICQPWNGKWALLWHSSPFRNDFSYPDQQLTFPFWSKMNTAEHDILQFWLLFCWTKFIKSFRETYGVLALVGF